MSASQNHNALQKIVILGGGTAGWMTAAALSKVMPDSLEISLVESEQIGSVGVGEATIPSIRLFNNLLGLDEHEFLRQTQGTIKLGIQFNDWARQGDSYLHAFGNLGLDLGMAKFFQYWLRAKTKGGKDSLWDYSFNHAAARLNRFQPIEAIPETPMAGLVYAFHFDANLYAQFLRGYAEQRGVRRIEGKVENVRQNSNTGFIESLQLESGNTVAGELFIDCSGFAGILIEQTLKAGYHDWSQWLPCDRAVAIPSASVSPLTPYTQSNAQDFGWQWRIPLQHRIGNGLVYCSSYLSDDEAVNTLQSNVEAAAEAVAEAETASVTEAAAVTEAVTEAVAEVKAKEKALGEPRVLRFTTGLRKKTWVKNCVAIGLSGGFMEPLESTSIHLIQSTISRLLLLFPDRHFSAPDRNEFNRQCQFEFERIRDFLILHYYANKRTDSEFWQQCANMSIPDSLRERLALFKTHGRIFRNNDELFTDLAWVQLLTGQGIKPERYHPVADAISEQQLRHFMRDIKHIIAREAKKLTTHEQYINQYCKAESL